MGGLFARPRRVVVTALQHAGKTTILYKLKLGQISEPAPGVERVRRKLFDFVAFDADNEAAAAAAGWEEGCALVFVVDANHGDSLAAAREQLARFRERLGDGVPVLVFAHKQDLPGARSGDEVASALGLPSTRVRDGRVRVRVEESMGNTGMGLYEGMEWLASALGEG